MVFTATASAPVELQLQCFDLIREAQHAFAEAQAQGMPNRPLYFIPDAQLPGEARPRPVLIWQELTPLELLEQFGQCHPYDLREHMRRLHEVYQTAQKRRETQAQ
jgi:hypothetical protein